MCAITRDRQGGHVRLTLLRVANVAFAGGKSVLQISTLFRDWHRRRLHANASVTSDSELSEKRSATDLRSVRGKTAGELQSPRSRWPSALPFLLCVFWLRLTSAQHIADRLSGSGLSLGCIATMVQRARSGQSHFQARLLSTNKSKLPVDLI